MIEKELTKIAKRYGITEIPKISKEDMIERDKAVEERYNKQYQQSTANSFLKLRSLKNEDDVLEQTFSDCKPVSASFVELAHKANEIAKEYANGERYKTILAGRAGTGKTMLGACILNYVHNNAVKPTNCLFVDVAEMSDLSFSVYRKEEHDRQARFRQLMKDIAETDVLLLDDLGSESSMQYQSSEASNTVQKTLFRIGNLMKNKAVIITTNNSESELEEIYNQKIVSRLVTGNPEHILNFSKVDDFRRMHN